MRGGGGDDVEPLAARGRAVHVVIPDTFPELTPPSRAHQAATGIWNTAACYGLESCAQLLHPCGGIVGRPAFLSSTAGEAARYIGRHFCVSRGDSGGVT